MKFSIKDLVIFTEEILNGKLHFLYSEKRLYRVTNGKLKKSVILEYLVRMISKRFTNLKENN